MNLSSLLSVSLPEIRDEHYFAKSNHCFVILAPFFLSNICAYPYHQSFKLLVVTWYLNVWVIVISWNFARNSLILFWANCWWSHLTPTYWILNQYQKNIYYHWLITKIINWSGYTLDPCEMNTYFRLFNFGVCSKRQFFCNYLFLIG